MEETKIEIVDQPSTRALFLLNESEKSDEKCLYAADNSNSKSNKGAKNQKNAIKIRVKNNNLKRAGVLLAIPVCSQSVDGKYYLHPNRLIIDKDNKSNPILRIDIKPDDELIEIKKLFILKSNKQDSDSYLKNLISNGIDPYQAGTPQNIDKIDFNQIRICFQAIFFDKNQKDAKKALATIPIVSDVINNIPLIQIINRPWQFYDEVEGGKEIMLMIRKIDTDSKYTIKARFYDDNEAFNVSVKCEYNHYKCALVFQVPKYKEKIISNDVNVNLQIIAVDTTNNDKIEYYSEPIKFTYRKQKTKQQKPLSYDEYYECEPIDNKNAKEIPKQSRQKLSKRTKAVWQIEDNKREEINNNDFIKNNFTIKYSNDANLHYLEPKNDRNADLLNNDSIFQNLFIDINKNNRVTQPTVIYDTPEGNQANNLSYENFNQDKKVQLISSNSNAFIDFDDIIENLNDYS